MATILRVKRRNSDEPLIALLVASKRCKVDDDSSDVVGVDSESTTVLKLAGTVKNQETDVLGHLVSTLKKDELKANYKKHSASVLDKVREKKRQATKEKRYKVINCLRSLDTSNYEDFGDDVTTLIDVEDSISCSTTEKLDDDDKNEDYVYDVYYANTDSNLYVDESVSIHPFHQEFIYDTYRTGDGMSDSESDSEDSNAENNWRNDYPDAEEVDCNSDEVDGDNLYSANISSEDDVWDDGEFALWHHEEFHDNEDENLDGPCESENPDYCDSDIESSNHVSGTENFFRALADVIDHGLVDESYDSYYKLVDGFKDDADFIGYESDSVRSDGVWEHGQEDNSDSD